MTEPSPWRRLCILRMSLLISNEDAFDATRHISPPEAMNPNATSNITGCFLATPGQRAPTFHNDEAAAQVGVMVDDLAHARAQWFPATEYRPAISWFEGSVCGDHDVSCYVIAVV